MIQLMYRYDLETMFFFIIPWVIYRFLVWLFTKRFSLQTELLKGMFFFSLVFIYMLTLFPFPIYSHDYLEGIPLSQRVNLIPFASIYGSLTHFCYMVPIRNIVGNIILFIPLGFLIPLRFKMFKLWKTAIFGFLVSLLVETIQLLFTGRSFDVDDLILNTFGAIAGFTCFNLLFLSLTKVKQRKTSLGT
ncbi:VanZ family protein [Bacillus carboniphilus]|uniref:VanZ family protein n=1 Tax=Bacillus carboniphilus TaxID=86663 RepID=A0ABY9JVY5_9BACI|nr:VanZ family protein [Bacillus carboniphilus]WLR42658.1 VanZ family protein [Bacillus carboniphilus]